MNASAMSLPAWDRRDAKLCSRGISSLHGAHHAAHKLTQVHLPWTGSAPAGGLAPSAALRDRGFFGASRPGLTSCPSQSLRAGTTAGATVDGTGLGTGV